MEIWRPKIENVTRGRRTVSHQGKVILKPMTHNRQKSADTVSRHYLPTTNDRVSLNSRPTFLSVFVDQQKVSEHVWKTADLSVGILLCDLSTGNRAFVYKLEARWTDDETATLIQFHEANTMFCVPADTNYNKGWILNSRSIQLHGRR